TRATLRSAEFGFFGVCVMTRVHTPRFCGAPRSAGVFDLDFGVSRPLRTSWLTVGMRLLRSGCRLLHTERRAGTSRPPNQGRTMVAKKPYSDALQSPTVQDGSEGAGMVIAIVAAAAAA